MQWCATSIMQYSITSSPLHGAMVQRLDRKTPHAFKCVEFPVLAFYRLSLVLPKQICVAWHCIKYQAVTNWTGPTVATFWISLFDNQLAEGWSDDHTNPSPNLNPTLALCSSFRYRRSRNHWSLPEHLNFPGRSPFYAVSVNCLYRDRVRVSGRVTDRVRFRVRVRRPDSSGNLLIPWYGVRRTTSNFPRVLATIRYVCCSPCP